MQQKNNLRRTLSNECDEMQLCGSPQGGTTGCTLVTQQHLRLEGVFFLKKMQAAAWWWNLTYEASDDHSEFRGDQPHPLVFISHYVICHAYSDWPIFTRLHILTYYYHRYVLLFHSVIWFLRYFFFTICSTPWWSIGPGLHIIEYLGPVKLCSKSGADWSTNKKAKGEKLFFQKF